MSEKSVIFQGDSYKALEDFPAEHRERFALSLDFIAKGFIPPLKTKFMNGLGEGVLELVKNGRPAYRCVYVVRDDAIHVLHAFSKTSDGTDKRHETTIKQRYKNIE